MPLSRSKSKVSQQFTRYLVTFVTRRALTTFPCVFDSMVLSQRLFILYFSLFPESSDYIFTLTRVLGARGVFICSRLLTLVVERSFSPENASLLIALCFREVTPETVRFPSNSPSFSISFSTDGGYRFNLFQGCYHKGSLSFASVNLPSLQFRLYHHLRRSKE